MCFVLHQLDCTKNCQDLSRLCIHIFQCVWTLYLSMGEHQTEYPKVPGSNTGKRNLVITILTKRIVNLFSCESLNIHAWNKLCSK